MQAIGLRIKTREFEDRRRYVRYRASLPCHFAYGGQASQGIIRDISKGGVLVESETLPLAGDQVEISLGEATAFRGCVVHGGRFLTANRNFTAFGVEFRQVMPQAQTLLAKAVEHFRPAQEFKRVMD